MKAPLEAPLDLWRLATARLRVLPDVLLLGAQRAGSTSLYRYLTQHPLFVPAITKEIHYFDRHWDRSLVWYRANFPMASYQRLVAAREGQTPITGEGTPNYLFHPGIPGRVAGLELEARFLVVLRDPVERAYSHYHHTRRNGWEHGTFRQALDREEKHLSGELERHERDPTYLNPDFLRYSYKARGRYAEQLERWFDHVDRDRFLILFSHDLFSDPNGTLDEVTEFLGLPGMELPEPKAHNRGTYEEMPAEIRKELEDHFAPHDRALEALLGRKVPWR